MQRHKELHTISEDSFVWCDYCSVSFKNKHHLIMHMRLKHVFEPSECAKCAKVFQNRKKLLNHLRLHDRSKKYECDICGKCYWKRTCLVAHMTEVHISKAEKFFTCDKCGFEFKLKRNYAKHCRRLVCFSRKMKNVPNNCRIGCVICSKKYLNIMSLRVHYRLQHYGDAALNSICLTCNRRFDDANQLCEHRRPNGNVFKCTDCPSVQLDCEVSYIHHLKTHLAANEAERTYRKRS